VWRTSVRGGLEVNFYADGVFVRTSYPHHISTVPENWPGNDILIPPDASGLAVAGLRVSSRALYESDFAPPTAAFAPDTDTTVLCRFNGDGKAWVRGSEVALETIHRP